MRLNFSKSFLISLTAVAIYLLAYQPAALVAEEKQETAAQEEKKDDGKLKPGVVASFGKHPHAAAVSAIDTSETEEGNAPVSGSISRKKDRCIATLMNNSGEASYSVNFAVIGTNAQGSQTFRRTYSASLKPKGSTTKEMSCGSDDNVRIEITSGKKLSK